LVKTKDPSTAAMHLSTTILAALSLTVRTVFASSNAQPNKYESCTNFDDVWCSDGELLTCYKAPNTVHGWVKGTQMACATKRQVEEFEKCFNYGEEWCSDGKILVCKKVPFVEQGRATSTKKKCAAKKKRGVGSWCDDLGMTERPICTGCILICFRCNMVSRLQSFDL
jgi:hypothetical protein